LVERWCNAAAALPIHFLAFRIDFFGPAVPGPAPHRCAGRMMGCANVGYAGGGSDRQGL
jgi:hypothetical protein